LKTIKGLVFILLLVCAIMLPTSAYASDNTTESISQYGFLQTFSLANIFSFLNKDYKAGDYHDYSWNNDGYHDRYDDDHHDDDDWWDDFCKWWNGDGGHDGGGGHDDECRESKGNWGNDDGCIDSAEIWKRWYCR
jgi:hypothetical protein